MNRRSFLGSTLLATLSTRHLTLARPRLEGTGDSAGPLRLDSNENPLGLAPSALAAIRQALSESNRYPFPAEARLLESLARFHSLARENLVLGAGSSEVLQMAVQAVAAPGPEVILPHPTFEAVEDYTLPFALKIHKVLLQNDFSHDLARMRELSLKARGPVLVYICNPNNPTGTLTSCSEIEAWIRSAPERVRFVVDEAYYHFVEDPAYHSLIPLALERPGVVVCRTFSKVYAMAGLRLGYGVGEAGTIRELEAFRSQINTNGLALAAGAAVLQDREFVRRSLESNRRGKRILTRCLKELGLRWLPSQTNFLLHHLGGQKLDPYIEQMRRHGIRVGRPFPPLLAYNRVSIGLPREMERFAETLRSFRKRGWI